MRSEGEQVNSVNPDLIVHTLTLESQVDQQSDSVKLFHYTEWSQFGKKLLIFVMMMMMSPECV